MTLMSPLRLKALVRKGERPTDVTLRKEMISTITQVSDRVLRFVISTPNPDRENDTIALDGWDLINFRRNPVVLWGHEQSCLPVGKATWIEIDDGALKADVEFVPGDWPHIGDKAEAVLRCCQNGFLAATSVGFRPLDYDIANDRDDGEGWCPPMDFKRQELLEFSIVTVPANAEALIEFNDLLAPGPTGLPLADVDADARAAQEAVEKEQRLRVERIRRAHRHTLMLATSA
ncbi:peptidase [Lichenicola cladoniae]|uniref:Peptidase n=1 Tax=Lichenicola cladoniae TaxID=1484109 RepID=A0A6M8HMZ7_9PROT|nr:HK97 family phage prohead protease [Lichenicola cladoniae]NPD67290.1 peptidase [Acetobacteraceae bacterium]QKE89793.1 peptidase [Lichenicola cladoniae]